MKHGCYYCEHCEDCADCPYYHPVTDEAIDAEIDKYIEQQRYDFYTEWFRYCQ